MTTPDMLLNRRYRLLEHLGTGGMAVVFKGQDLSLRRYVAIKILRQDQTHHDEFLTRFQYEARSVANLAHPNIVTLHDFGADGNRYYMVMEYIDGQDLKTLIRNQAPLPIDQALNYMVQICSGVGYAHRAGIIHCDLKPQNVLITKDGRLKVTDFGIARALSNIQPDEKNEIVWGSPQYFAPEQASGSAPTPASDVYSLGIVLYEMLTGQLPFDSPEPQKLALMHLKDEPPSVRALNPDVPIEIDQIIQKVLAKEPTARYRTADQLGHVLRTLRQRTSASETTGLFPVSRPDTATASTPPVVRPDPAAPAGQSIGTSARAANGGRTGDYPSKVAMPALAGVSVPFTANSSNLEAVAEEGADWTYFLLLFVAVVAVLGLFPLWLLVYLRYIGS